MNKVQSEKNLIEIHPMNDPVNDFESPSMMESFSRSDQSDYVEKDSAIFNEFLLIDNKKVNVIPKLMIDPNCGPKTVWNIIMLVLVVF